MRLVTSSPRKLAAILLFVSMSALLCWHVEVWRCKGRTPTLLEGDAIEQSNNIFTPLMMILDLIYSLLLATIHGRRAPVETRSGARLPSYPLAVKSPYLSTWVPGRYMDNAARAQPEFWNDQHLSWPVLARIDGKTCALFGDPGEVISDAAQTESVTYTSTHTYIYMSTGSVKFVLDFFTPFFPGKDEYAKQSLPYSYLTVNATNTASKTTSIQIFSGIDQTWTSQHGKADVNYTTAGSAGFLWFYNSDARPFNEERDMATWGSVLFGASMDDGAVYTCGPREDVVSSFSEGDLPIAPTCEIDHLVAISKDLGHVGGSEPTSGTSSSATFVVGFQRDDAIDYLGTPQTGYHRSKWPTIPEQVEYVVDNYESALAHSLSFDTLIREKAEGVSDEYGHEYADIVEASVRQMFASMEITVPHDELNATPSVFLKEISSNGNLNTVDLIFQSWPIFISLNPEYIRMLFQPIISYLDAGRWPHPFVIHDMGYHYPNATGHVNGWAERMPLFETSTLFIILLAYQQLSGDMDYAVHYEPLLRGYAEWLYNDNALYPKKQLISVDAVPPRANQTGLAIQSAIGLNAAGVLLNDTKYSALAAEYVSEIYVKGLGVSEDSTHFTYYYGEDETWNVLYPAFSDVLLGLDTFPQEAWEMQTQWYLEHIYELGLPWAGPIQHKAYEGQKMDWALLDWNIVYAAASSPELQQAVVKTSHAFLTNGKNDQPFGTKYPVTGPQAGKWMGPNKARPTVGSNFAILAMKEGLIYP